MIKFRFQRKDKENVKSENNKISTKKDLNGNKKDGKPPKGVKKEYLDCIRAVVVSFLFTAIISSKQLTLSFSSCNLSDGNHFLSKFLKRFFFSLSYRNYFNNYKQARSQHYVQNRFDEPQLVAHWLDADFHWAVQVMQPNALNFYCIVCIHIYRPRKVIHVKRHSVWLIDVLQCVSSSKVYVNVVPIRSSCHLRRFVYFTFSLN